MFTFPQTLLIYSAEYHYSFSLNLVQVENGIATYSGGRETYQFNQAEIESGDSGDPEYFLGIPLQ